MAGERLRKVLTRAEEIVMLDLADWLTPQELTLKRGYTKPSKASSGYGRMLSRLTNDGLVEHRRSDHRFRLTEAGRAAVAHHDKEQASRSTDDTQEGGAL